MIEKGDLMTDTLPLMPPADPPRAMRSPGARVAVGFALAVLGLVAGALVSRGIGDESWASAVQHLVAAMLGAGLLTWLGQGSWLTRAAGIGHALRVGWGLLAVALVGTAFTLSAVTSGLTMPAPHRWLAVLLDAAATGVAEETLFRGVVLVALLERAGVLGRGRADVSRTTTAVLQSAAIFGVFHLVNLTGTPDRPVAVLTQVGYTALVGVLLGAVLVRTGSLLGVAVLHAVFDLISDIGDALTGGGGTPAAGDLSWGGAVITLLLVLPCLPLGMRLLRRGPGAQATAPRG
ncbi:CPBP family intramembrane glutamic endopeptidase [Arsenicicoccus dermatophilus]|uniref:CPBP family intramembrane glutamic endopeptidase n=1 Tax=Arsenicicoccus dermatophilus TaxID=1076331 RepID=UPI001F4CB222|nr:CPBP family intramembrane glutamic endopeptidase [Arsenicicoccus dermatophilus]MCH8611696.1 CPBP family intramembrane metalloprotease [Arsenicicoccus dermatophilus]